MSQPKTKEELVRLAWVAALRREGDRQCDGQLFQGNKVCALGLLAVVSGLGRRANAVVARWGDFDSIGRRAGLAPFQTTDIYSLNDSGSTFAEIADVVEGWFKN